MRSLMFPIFAVALLAGCQNSHKGALLPPDDPMRMERRDCPASLVFESPSLRSMSKSIAWDDTPWYASRSDARRATRFGSQSAVTSITRTITTDRQHFHNNRPQHHYDRTTRRYQVTVDVR